MNKAIQISEQALRLALAVAVLAMAAWTASSNPASRAGAVHLPKPGAVTEW